MKQWFLKDIVPLLIILAILSALTIIPYKTTQHQLSSDEKTQTYLCKFSAVMREFANTAANARLNTARNGAMNLKKVNLHAARVYVHVRNELKTLPPDINCKELIGR